MFQPNKTLMTMAVNNYAVTFQKHNSLAGGEKEERCYQPDDDWRMQYPRKYSVFENEEDSVITPKMTPLR
jgi:hypothetical protein